MLIHASLLVAVQAQPAPALTVTVPVVAADDARFDERGEIVNVHGAPAWVTVNVLPAIVSVPVREVEPVLAPTLYVTVPLPVPLAPAVTLSQPALVVAVQTHPALAVTVTVPVVATEVVRFDDTGEIENEHGAPAWLTVNVCPAMVTVPVRDPVPVFAATLYDTVPLPLPLAPAVIVIHAALLVDVHAHPAPAVTVTVPLTAADEVSVEDEGRIVNEHGMPGCVMVNVLPAIVSVPVREVVFGFAATL